MAALSVERACVSGEMNFYGFAVISQLLGDTTAEEFQATIYKACDLLIVGRERSDIAQQNLLWFYCDILMHQASDLLAERDSKLFATYSEFVEFIAERTRYLFGSAWQLRPGRSYFFRQFGRAKKPTRRIDVELGAKRRDAFNVWIPLQSRGKSLPALDLIPGSHRAVQDMTRLSNDQGDWRDTFARSLGSRFTPELIFGDAVAIDKFTLYRTQSLDLREKNCFTCEFCFQYAPWHKISSLWHKIGRTSNHSAASRPNIRNKCLNVGEAKRERRRHG